MAACEQGCEGNSQTLGEASPFPAAPGLGGWDSNLAPGSALSLSYSLRVTVCPLISMFTYSHLKWERYSSFLLKLSGWEEGMYLIPSKLDTGPPWWFSG